ncbi:ABC transporter ATP-binding protein [Terrarubrum flagellatum]|uniref:ABC transporter ATP-binding protein n=1 Tax=Terrirubrum flagellatum TaxID=2895980 RepID=UPI0031452349
MHCATEPVISADSAISDERETLLDVRDLRVAFPGPSGYRNVIDGLNLKIRRGEIVALVGESGSGKSMTALSLMRLLPAGAKIMSGRVMFRDHDVLGLSATELGHMRGGHISMIFQQPQAMLDPTSRVGTQVAESLWKHRKPERSSIAGRVARLLADVGIPEPALRARCFSYELSGGMAQRVMMAAAMSGEPQLLIADEPTTALDVTVQAQILQLLDEQRRKRDLAVLLITHDLSIVSALADRVAVMYAGRIVEEGPARRILKTPRHPYTRALIQCSLLQTDSDGHLFSIPTGAARAQDIEKGCRFLPRCATAATHGVSHHCTHDEPGLEAYDHHCSARCWAVEAPAPSVAHEARAS